VQTAAVVDPPSEFSVPHETMFVWSSKLVEDALLALMTDAATCSFRTHIVDTSHIADWILTIELLHRVMGFDRSTIDNDEILAV